MTTVNAESSAAPVTSDPELDLIFKAAELVFDSNLKNLAEGVVLGAPVLTKQQFIDAIMVPTLKYNEIVNMAYQTFHGEEA